MHLRATRKDEYLPKTHPLSNAIARCLTPRRASVSCAVGICVAVLAPVGLLVGFGFPTGMRLVNAHDRRPTPWFWGINGASGVLASVMAVACSIAFGITTSLFISAACYLLVVPAAWRIGVAAPPAPAREA